MLPEPIVENLVPGLDQQDKVRGLGMDLGHWGSGVNEACGAFNIQWKKTSMKRLA